MGALLRTIGDRSSLRDQTREVLVEAILAGLWPAGERIPLAEVAADLGVSVTPVREALSQLVHEGLVVARPAQGFFVTETDVAQARQLYPILGALESLAVRSSPPYKAAAIASFERLNERLELASDSASEAGRLDLRWHKAVTGNCGNDLLLGKMEELRRRVGLIEAAYMRRSELRSRSAAQHRAITDLLRRRRRDEAAELLERHWQLSVEFVDEAAGEPNGEPK